MSRINYSLDWSTILCMQDWWGVVIICALAVLPTRHLIAQNKNDADPDAVVTVLHQWGTCSIPCTADINHDGMVNVEDLLFVLSGVGLSDDGTIPSGFKLIEGDILIRIDEAEKMLLGTYTTTLWPTSVIPYEFNTNMTQPMQDRAVTGMNRWAAVANLNFVVRTTETAYLHFQNSNRNSSPVGYANSERIINIFNWDFFTVEHEIAHSLGFWHEQSRADRNTYVTVIIANVQPLALSNFNIRPAGGGEYGFYDFDSVMHYSQCAFTTCGVCAPGCETILVNPPWDVDWQLAIGQLDHLSKMDKLTMSFLYSQSNWRFADQAFSGATQTGTFLQPMASFVEGVNVTPVSGTLFVQPGNYSQTTVISKAMTIEAPLGSVSIGN